MLLKHTKRYRMRARNIGCLENGVQLTYGWVVGAAIKCGAATTPPSGFTHIRPFLLNSSDCTQRRIFMVRSVGF